METDKPEFWYRAEISRYAYSNEWGDYMGSYPSYRINKYRVDRHTPKGVVIAGVGFVLGKSVKQFCVPTEDLAIKDLIARCNSNVSGCKARLQIAEENLSLALSKLENSGLCL